MRPSLLLKALGAFRHGRIGDAGLYKAVALSARPYPEVLAAVSKLAEPLPDIAGLALTEAPQGSVGYAFREFVETHRITPLSVSAQVREEVAPLNLVAARYLLVHDLFHVLLGFDVSRAGELAVWSFVAEQHYCPTYERAAKLAAVVYPLAEPASKAALAQHRAKGQAMAREVPCLLAQPLEGYWLQPLGAARHKLGIRTANDA